jgi:hypothetical protein
MRVIQPNAAVSDPKADRFSQDFFLSPNFQSLRATRAAVLQRSDPRLQSPPTSSAPITPQPTPPASPADQTDRALRSQTTSASRIRAGNQMYKRAALPCQPRPSHWRSYADQGLHSRIRRRCPQSNRRTKRESCKDQGQMKLRIQPVERGFNIFNFPAAVIVFAMAESSAPKVEAQAQESRNRSAPSWYGRRLCYAASRQTADADDKPPPHASHSPRPHSAALPAVPRGLRGRAT